MINFINDKIKNKFFSTKKINNYIVECNEISYNSGALGYKTIIEGSDLYPKFTSLIKKVTKVDSELGEAVEVIGEALMYESGSAVVSNVIATLSEMNVTAEFKAEFIKKLAELASE